jgi:hypothetical protein
MMSRELRPITTLTALDALTLTGALFSPARTRSVERPIRSRKAKEVVFEISQDAHKGFCARCVTENVSTQAETWEKLRANIRQAVKAFPCGHYRPNQVQLHIVHDEMLTL